jgi:hypothetical protein
MIFSLGFTIDEATSFRQAGPSVLDAARTGGLDHLNGVSAVNAPSLLHDDSPGDIYQRSSNRPQSRRPSRAPPKHVDSSIIASSARRRPDQAYDILEALAFGFANPRDGRCIPG